MSDQVATIVNNPDESPAKTKHQLNADQSDQLTRMQQAYQESKR